MEQSHTEHVDIEAVKKALKSAGVLHDDPKFTARISEELAKQGASAPASHLICSRAHYCIVVKE